MTTVSPTEHSRKADLDFYWEYLGHCKIVAGTIRRTYRLPKADEEDLIQILSTKLLTIPPHHRAKGPAFIRTCLNNAARDVLRRILRGEQHSLPCLVDPQSDHDPDAEFRIEHMLSCLTPQERELVSLSVGLDGPKLTIREIAALLDMPVSTATKDINRAMTKMRASLTNSVLPFLSGTN